MKLLKLLPIFALSLFFYGSVCAQSGDYGENPDQCRVNLSTYTEFFNQENYKDALNSWRWCFNYCPASTRNIYIHGTKIIEYYIENAADEDSKQAYIDTLMMVYDNRIKYFNQEPMVLGRKAIALLTYRPGEVMKAYEIMKDAFQKGGNETEFHVIGYYMNVAVVLFTNQILDAETIVKLYSDLMNALDYQISTAPDQNRAGRIQQIKDRVEDLFVNSGAADCPAIIKLFGPQLEANPSDVELAEKIINLLDRGKTDDCQLDDLYMKAAVLVYENEKNAKSAHSIAQGYFKRNESDNAEKFYLEAIELEEDQMRKADLYYELGLLYFSQFNNFPKARNSAREALRSNPDHGKAYMLIGRAYAAGGRDCGESTLQKKALWWVVVDQFIKAKRVDPSVAEDADEQIGKYAPNFPTQEEGFWENVNEGDSFTVGCWINETTTVRFAK